MSAVMAALVGVIKLVFLAAGAPPELAVPLQRRDRLARLETMFVLARAAAAAAGIRTVRAPLAAPGAPPVVVVVGVVGAQLPAGPGVLGGVARCGFTATRNLIVIGVGSRSSHQLQVARSLRTNTSALWLAVDDQFPTHRRP